MAVWSSRFLREDWARFAAASATSSWIGLPARGRVRPLPRMPLYVWKRFSGKPSSSAAPRGGKRSPAMVELSTLLIPVIAVVVLLALMMGAWLIGRNYIKVSPNVVAVFSGRRRKLPDGKIVGYRMVKGGAALRVPVLEKVEYLSLNVFTIGLEIKRAYTVKGVPVSVKAVANVKIRSDDTSLQAAAER